MHTKQKKNKKGNKIRRKLILDFYLTRYSTLILLCNDSYKASRDCLRFRIWDKEKQNRYFLCDTVRG